MRWPWQRAQAGPIEPKRASVGSNGNGKAMELQAAMEILAEIFHIQPADVEEMLIERLEERNHHQECREGLWPATFSLGE